jgi:hypothetical protein
MSEEFQAGATHGQEGGHRDDAALRVFKRLRRGEVATVEHGFGSMPLVDVYGLASFPVVSSADEMKEPVDVQFYVYHTNDRSARVKADEGIKRITVEDPDDPPARIPFARALEIAGVEYDDDSTLGDTVTDFWSRFFAKPSDPFDETSYSNSPWIDVNVGDRRTVGELKKGGGWDDLWLTFRAYKTINGPSWSSAGGGAGGGGAGGGVPANLFLESLDATEAVLGGDRNKALAILHEIRVRIKEGAATGGGAADGGSGGDPGAPPGVAVMQLGLDAVGLRLMDGGPDEVAVMVLLRR